jgi:hypothetical protein
MIKGSFAAAFYFLIPGITLDTKSHFISTNIDFLFTKSIHTLFSALASLRLTASIFVPVFRKDPRADQNHIQHQERLHSRGGGASPQGERVVRGALNNPNSEDDSVAVLRKNTIIPDERDRIHCSVCSYCCTYKYKNSACLLSDIII